LSLPSKMVGCGRSMSVLKVGLARMELSEAKAHQVVLTKLFK
jgi:hypothetical protein